MKDKNLLFDNVDKENNLHDFSNINEVYSTQESVDNKMLIGSQYHHDNNKPFIEKNNGIFPVIRSQSNLPIHNINEINDFDMNIDDNEDYNSAGRYSDLSSLNDNSFISNKEISSDCISYGNFSSYNNFEIKTQSLAQTFKKSCCVKKKAKVHTKRIKSLKNVQIGATNYECYEKQNYDDDCILESDKPKYDHINNINICYYC